MHRNRQARRILKLFLASLQATSVCLLVQMIYNNLLNQYNYKDIIVLIMLLFYLFYDSLMIALAIEGGTPNRDSSVI